MWFDKKKKTSCEKFKVYREIEMYLSQYRDSKRKRVPVLYLYNFRSFRGFHAIELAELTFLYGANSTGKSALYEAIMEAVDVLSKKTSLSYSLEMNRTWGLKDDEPYGIGLGGVWGFDTQYIDRHPVLSSHEDNYGTYKNYTDFIENNFFSSNQFEAWDCFVIKDGGSACSGATNVFHWWREQLLFDYSANTEDFTIYDLVNHPSISSDYKEFVEAADSWAFETFQDRKLNDISSDDNVYKDFRLDDSSNPLHMDPFTLRSQEFIRKTHGEVTHIEKSIFTGVETELDRKLEKGVIYKNSNGIEKEIPDKGNQCLSEYYINGYLEGSADLWDLDEWKYHEAFIRPTDNLVIQVFLYFINSLPKEIAGKFNTRKISSIRPIPLDKDMVAEYSFMQLEDGARVFPKDSGSNIDVWKHMSWDVMRNIYPECISEYSPSSKSILKKVNQFFSLSKWMESPYKLDYELAETWAVDKKGHYKFYYPDIVKVTFKLKSKNIDTEFAKVGTGYSQVLPVIVGLLSEQRIFISQPELHLHPKRAYALGRFLINSRKLHQKSLFDFETLLLPGGKTRKRKVISGNNLWSVFETHSPELLQPTLNSIASNQISAECVRVYVLTKDGAETTLTQIRIDEDGDFMDSWPGGYFDEAMY